MYTEVAGVIVGRTNYELEANALSKAWRKAASTAPLRTLVVATPMLTSMRTEYVVKVWAHTGNEGLPTGEYGKVQPKRGTIYTATA
mgnify:CR=1 FL=1